MSTNYDGVAHAFAHKQGDAKAYGNRMFIDGDALYSYGRHFMIAKHVINAKRERAVLFTLQSNSVTTNKHIGITRNACSHLHLLYVPDPKDSFEANIGRFERYIKEQLKGLLNARKPEKYIQPAERLLEQAREYALFFGKKIPKQLEKLVLSAKDGKYTEYLQKEAARIQREEKERAKKVLADFKISVLKFRQGKGKRIDKPFNIVKDSEMENDFLRYNGRTKRIETSQGVEIPIAIAKRAFNWIKLTRDAGGCLGECGYKILDFEVKEVNADFVKIGCHKLTHAEIDRMGAKMKW